MLNLPVLKQHLEEILLKAGKLILIDFKNKPTGVYKKPTGWVTDTDSRIELYYKEQLTNLLPNSNFWGEETGVSGSEFAEYTWIVDPLDGTYNFVSGIPLFVTGVALSYQNQIILSAVFDPNFNEIYFGFDNKSWCNNKLLKNLDKKIIVDQIISLNSCSQEFSLLRKNCGSVRRLGSALLTQCWLASGKIGAAIFNDLFWWDIAPALLIMKNADILITNFANQEIKTPASGKIICASNFIHKTILDNYL